MFCILSISNLDAQNFTEIGASIGIDYDFATNEYGGGVSFVDFDQDGYDDLTFATNLGLPIRIHQNTGSGFQLLTTPIDNTEEIKQVLWVDFNNDGLLDLYLSGSGQNTLYKNLGGYTFENITTTAGLNDPVEISYTATWFDYDQDGYLDLFSTYRTKDTTGAVTLYRNLGNETFEDMTEEAGLYQKGNSVLAMTSFDYNNDGHIDLFLAQDWEQGNQLLENNGNGTFKDVSDQANVNQRMNSMTATVGDYNMDGWMDIYVSNTVEGNILLKNNRNGTFTDVSAAMNVNIRALTFGSAFFDADSDGDLELQVVGFQSNYLFENLRPGDAFIRVDQEWGFTKDKDFNNGLALGDYDNNGALDLVRNSVTLEDHVTSKNTFYQNNLTTNNFLKVRLTGTVSNRFAVGSRLTLHTNEQRLIRRIAVGESFSSQHSYTQHFGMGQATFADSLIIDWPNGNKTVVLNIEPNQVLNLTEPTYGCLDNSACNYNPNATQDNGTCRYPTEYMTCLACNQDADKDGVCDELEVYGCTDKYSCSYNPLATEEDGSCEYLSSFEISGAETVYPFQPESYTYPFNEGSSYEWSITNGSIAFGQGLNQIQVFWHNTQPTGKLSVVESDADGCLSNTVEFKVIIEAKPLSSIANKPVIAYPNPASDYIQLTLDAHEPVMLTIINMSGKKILQTATTGKAMIDIRQFNPGTYLLQINDQNSIHYQKLKIIH